MKKKHNMTLIELLVVLAIIGIIASIIMPTLRQARESAIKTDCVNNLKQISYAYVMYEDDWGVYPEDGFMLDDFSPIYTYINSLEVFDCKASDDYQVTDTSHLDGATDYLRNGVYDVTDAQAGINWELEAQDPLWTDQFAIAFLGYYQKQFVDKLSDLMFKAVEDNPYNISDEDALIVASLGEGVYDRDINNHRKINFVAMDGTYSELISAESVWQIDDNGNASTGNNGHGNNDDGVDSSNPGQGQGGPNGAEDSDPAVDDESGSGGNGNGRGRN